MGFSFRNSVFCFSPLHVFTLSREFNLLDSITNVALVDNVLVIKKGFGAVLLFPQTKGYHRGGQSTEASQGSDVLFHHQMTAGDGWTLKTYVESENTNLKTETLRHIKQNTFTKQIYILENKHINALLLRWGKDRLCGAGKHWDCECTLIYCVWQFPTV